MQSHKKVKIKLQCSSFNGNYEDIITSDVIKSYKDRGDDSPHFKVFTVAHEGDSTGSLIGYGKIVQRYTKQVIQKLYDGLRNGVKAYLGHQEGTNDNTGRKAIGEVVGSRLEEVGGQLRHLAAFYIYPQFRDQKLDVASIETNVHCERGHDNKFDVVDVEPITGIALGDGAKDTPGFAGATLQAQLQAFEEEDDNVKITIADVREFIAQNNMQPSDIFTKGQLDKDDVVEGIKKAHSQKEFDHRKKVEEHLDQEKEKTKELTTKVDELNTSLGTFKSKVESNLTQEYFSALVEENKYADPVKKFLEVNFKNFKPGEYKDEKDLKKQVGDFVSASAKEAAEYAKAFGVQLKDDKPAVPGSDAPDIGPDSDMTNPAMNDFIPSGV